RRWSLPCPHTGSARRRRCAGSRCRRRPSSCPSAVLPVTHHVVVQLPGTDVGALVVVVRPGQLGAGVAQPIGDGGAQGVQGRQYRADRLVQAAVTGVVVQPGQVADRLLEVGRPVVEGGGGLVQVAEDRLVVTHAVSLPSSGT